MAGYKLTLEFDFDGSLTGVKDNDNNYSAPVGNDDLKSLKKGGNGIRPILSIYDLTNPSSEEETGTCYQIIGGFKVKVPCT